MGETLHSVGIDVGTSTTQLIFSRLTVENRACLCRSPTSPSETGRSCTEAPFILPPFCLPQGWMRQAFGKSWREEYRLAGN